MTTPLIDDLKLKYVRRTPHMVDIGLEVTDVGPGRGTMRQPARPDWLGDPGRQVLHPGVITVLADSACGLAVGAALSQRMPYATLDLRMDHLRPAGPGHDLNCEAHCYRVTRSVAFVRAEVWQHDRAQPIATAQATFMLSTPMGRPRAQGQAVAPPPPPPPAVAGGWQPPPAHAPVQLPPPLDRPIPYVDYLGLRVSPQQGAEAPLYRLPYQQKLIGNPYLPALHGGVIAGFAESAAMLHLVHTLAGAKLPKGIDFSIDYLRAGRPEETFAACELVRLGGRVALVLVRCWQARGPEHPIAVARGHFLLTEATEAATTDMAGPAATAVAPSPTDTAPPTGAGDARP